MPVAKAGSGFIPAPEGTHLARCFACISLGTQHSQMFADSWKVMFIFELPNEMVERDGAAEPMTVTKEYTLSLGKKSTLRQHLQSWRGRAFTDEELNGFEVSNVVGAPCQITIQHKTSASGNVRADIAAITGLPKGMKVPDQYNKSVRYEIDQKEDETFRALPEWIRNKIKSCEEWKPSTVKSAHVQVPMNPQEPDPSDDEVPF